MAIKINVGFGERITSAGINEKIAGLAGKDFKIEGLEARFTGQNQITVSPGKCMMQGAVIESDADIIVEIPTDMQSKAKLDLCGIYNHEQRSFEIKTYPDCYIGDLELATVDMVSRGIHNKLEKMDNTSILDLLENPDRVEIKRFVSETGEEIVFDSVYSSNAADDFSADNGLGLISDGVFACANENTVVTDWLEGDFVFVGEVRVQDAGALAVENKFLDSGDWNAGTGKTSVFSIVVGRGGDLSLHYHKDTLFKAVHLNKLNVNIDGSPNTIVVAKIGATVSVTANGITQSTECIADKVNSHKPLVINSNSAIKTRGALYGRQLMDEEITHNFKILEANRDYIEHRTDAASAVIEGFTYRNMLPNGRFSDDGFTSDNFRPNFWEKIAGYGDCIINESAVRIKSRYANVGLFKSNIQGVTFVEGHRYAFVVDMRKGNFPESNGNLWVSIGRDGSGIWRNSTRVSNNEDEYKLCCGITEPFVPYTRNDTILISGINNTLADAVLRSIMVFDLSYLYGDNNIPTADEFLRVIREYIPHGLNPVQASISNNDNNYAITEPLVIGSTKIMNSQTEVAAGSRDARLVSLMPNSNLLPSLGSVGSIYDQLDIADMMIRLRTKEIIIDGSEKWIVDKSYCNSATTKIYITDFFKNNKMKPSTLPVCNALNSVSMSTMQSLGTNYPCIANSDAGSLNIRIPKVENDDIDLATQYLRDLYVAKNPLTIRGVLSSEDVILIDNTKLMSYSEHFKTIELDGIKGVRDTLEIHEDGSATWTKRLQEFVLTDRNATWGPFEPCALVDGIAFGGTGVSIDTAPGNYNYNAAWCDKYDCWHYFGPREQNRETLGITNGRVAISILKSRLETEDVDGFKKWLSQNPLKIKYVRSNPVITKIPASLVPKFLQQKHTEVTTNRVSLNSPTIGKLTVTVPTIPADNHRDLREMMLAQKAEHEAGKTSVITSDGEEIVINQGSEVGSAAIARIEGQTVKNYLSESIIKNIHCNSLSGKKPHSIVENGVECWLFNAPSGTIIDKPALNSKYYVKIRTKASDKNSSTGVGFYIKSFYADGTYKNELLVGNLDKVWHDREAVITVSKETTAIGFSWGIGDQILIDKQCIFFVEEKDRGIISSATKEVIAPAKATLTVVSEGGTATTNIYEPIVKGKTVVVDANGDECLPGSVGAELISLYPTDASLPPLCSAGHACDEIDFIKKTITKRVKEILITGNEAWKSQSVSTDTVRVQFTDLSISGHTDNVYIGCAKLYPVSNKSWSVDAQQIELDVNSMIGVRVLKSNISTPDASGVVEWIKNNNFKITCILKKPEIINLTDEQMMSYMHLRKPIELNRVGDVADEIIVNEDGSATWIKRNDKLNVSKYTYNLHAGFEKNLCGIVHDSSYDCATDRSPSITDTFKCVNPTYFGSHDGERLIGFEGWSGRTNRIWVAIPKSDAPDIVTFNKILRDIGESCIYRRLNHQVVHIPKELMPKTPLALQPGRSTVTSGGSIRPSSIDVKVNHGDRVLNKTHNEAKKTYFNIEAKTNGLASITSGKLVGRTDKNYLSKSMFTSPYYKWNGDKLILLTSDDRVGFTNITLQEGSYFFKCDYESRIIIRAKTGNYEFVDVVGTEAAFYISAPTDIYIKFSQGYGSAGAIGAAMPISYEVGRVSLSHSEVSEPLPMMSLHSSKAIIENGEFEARIYDPIISGQTKIMNNGSVVAPTTLGASLVSLKPSTNELPELGNIGSICDTLDLRSGELTIRTKQIILDGSEQWISYTLEPGGTKRMLLSIPDIKYSDQGRVVTSSAPIKTVTYINSWNNNFEGLAVTGKNLVLYLIADSESDFRGKIRNNPICLRYILDSPIIVKLTRDQANLYRHLMSPISLNGTGEYHDTLEFIGDSGALLTRNLLNAHMNGLEVWSEATVAANKFSTFYVQSIGKFKPPNNSQIFSMCNSTDSIAGIDEGKKIGMYDWGANTYLYFNVPSTTKQSWLDNMITNNLDVVYPLNNPQIIHIPPEFIEYLPIHRGKNVLSAGGAVKADIVESLQLEFNDNIYDKAPVPTIKNDKITGLYLPELRKHFDLGVEQPVVSNPNLLINGGFRVWQRGDISTAEVNPRYSADRWCHNRSTVTKISDGVKVLAISDSGYLNQKIWPSDVGIHRGQSITMSISIKSITGKARLSIDQRPIVNYSPAKFVRTDIENPGIYSITMKDIDIQQLLLCEIYIYKTDSMVEIEWIKLEIGEAATPFQHKLYDEEFMLCQRYYQQVVPSEVNIPIVTSNSAGIYMPLRTPMKSPGTVLMPGATNTYWIKQNGTGTAIFPTGFAKNSNENQIYIACNGVTLDTTKPYTFVASGGIYVDAEIY